MAICWITRFIATDIYFQGLLLPWLGLGYATIFATLYAYNAYSWAGKRVSPAITTVYNTLQPVGTSILSVVFLHHAVTLPEIIGGLLVMIGLIITVYGRQREVLVEKINESDIIGEIDESGEDLMNKKIDSNRYLSSSSSPLSQLSSSKENIGLTSNLLRNSNSKVYSPLLSQDIHDK